MALPEKRLVADWLTSYLDLTADLEAKEQLHLWTGLSVISAVIRRKLYLNMDYGPVFPNLYVIMVAESAKARKSTAADYGHNLLVDAMPDLNIMRDSMTSQGLIKSLNHKTQIVEEGKIKEQMRSDVWIHADEVANLFSYDRTRAAQLTIFLTRAYGCPPTYEHTTVKDSKIKLFNLYPGLLGATDPRNLKVFPEEAVTGLTGRLIWLIEKSRRKNNPGWVNSDSKSELRKTLLREYLIHDLQRISNLQGRMSASPEAQALYTTWYNELSERDTKDPETDAFYNRCHVTALRLAILLAVSENDTLIISEKKMKEAIALIEMQLPEVKRVMLWSGASQYEQHRAKLIHYLQNLPQGAALRQQLLKHMGMQADEFEKVVITLVQDGTIKTVDMGGKGTVITLTKAGLTRQGGAP